MKSYVGVTDRKWFDILRARPDLVEVNFWMPSGRQRFQVLKPGELFLFKLHSPNNYIVGGGFFAHFSFLPITLAWESFGVGNGANGLADMRERIAKYRSQNNERTADFTIGCILLEQPFFLPEDKWIPAPIDWSSNIVQGKTYDLTAGPGLLLWNQLQTAMTTNNMVRENAAQYGEPILIRPRLGQGSFRILVTDAYERRCAITNERTLPALDAAHIKPYSESGIHEIYNGILLRRDVHALFDLGYLTITSTMNIEVSSKIKEEFENGKEYYRYHGNTIHLPADLTNYPSTEFLDWHNTNVYRG